MARQLVCDELGLSPASIKSLATKMRKQRALPKNERTQYHDLIHFYEDERERLKKICSGSAQQPEPDVLSLIINEVINLAAQYGKK